MYKKLESIRVLVIRQQEDGAALYITNVPLKGIQDKDFDFDQDLIYKCFEEKFEKEFHRSFCDWFEVSGEINYIP